jgi:trehalose synthase
MREAGARVLWRAHVGADEPNEHARRAWEFLKPYLAEAEAFAFSRPAYVWPGLDSDKVFVIPPSIDPFSPKNQDLEAAAVRAILAVTEIGPDAARGPATFVRTDGTPGRVDRAADTVQDGPVPADSPVVTQVSRWDRLKDPAGLIAAFERGFGAPGCHLLLAGPDVRRVVDDPEGSEVLAELVARRAELPGELRSRVHLASLPLEDIEENAAVVNAIQRRSDVVVQNSVAEGFGLTVTEAMWKGRPVVATRVGGIQDQIAAGHNGLLVRPGDPAGLAEAVASVLADPALGLALGSAARETVAEKFIVTGRLVAYFRIFESLLSQRPETAVESVPTR